jgi:ferrous iron transport protein A
MFGIITAAEPIAFICVAFEKESQYYPSMNKKLLLSDLQPGERAVISRCNHDHFRNPRLLEMGMVEGTEVHFIKRAPLGDPIQLQLRGYYLSIRNHDAAHIEVEKVA